MSELMIYLKAFVVGGAICTIGQILMQTTKLTSARILVLFVVSGVILTGLGVYKPLVDFAGAGATVPISWFGYLLANGAMQGAERGFFGAITGALSSASAGVSAAVIFSFLMAVIFKSKSKRS